VTAFDEGQQEKICCPSLLKSLFQSNSYLYGGKIDEIFGHLF